MNDAQLLRYSRQIMLPQVDIKGQEQLLSARALIVGAGGLGSPAAMYLAAAGVGHLVVADHDVVESSNLQRQLLHHDSDIGRNKVDSARDTLTTINPDIRVSALAQTLQGEALDNEVRQADVVLDCSDNFATRFDVNRACVAHRTPLVSGAAIRMEGQVAVFDSSAGKQPLLPLPVQGRRGRRPDLFRERRALPGRWHHRLTAGTGGPQGDPLDR